MAISRGHLGQKERITRVDLRKQANRGHGLQTAGRVLRMAVDVFEAVELAVREIGMSSITPSGE